MITFTPPSASLLGDLQLRYRPQRQWGQGRGALLVLAHFLSGVGAGAWLAGSATGDFAAMVTGWSLVAVGGLAHLLFLGRWSRFWRMVARPQSSWISRGLLGMSLFLVTGAAYLALAMLGDASLSAAGPLWWLSVLGAAWVLLYKGFVWASSKGIPFWNTPLLPPLYIAYGVRGGLAVVLLVTLATVPASQLAAIETVKLWLGVSAALLVLIYLAVVRGTGLTAAESVHMLLSGSAAGVFYAGVVVLGLLVPLGVGIYALWALIGGPLVSVAAVASLLGDLALIYGVARAGLYRPLPF